MAPHQRQRARAEHTGQAQVEEGFDEALQAADGRSGDQDHLCGRPMGVLAVLGASPFRVHH